MSANLLNAAAMPAAAPGAGVGIAAQAAHAAQAHGPMAGFEALLAAFFGDQGLIAPGAAGPAIAGQALAVEAGSATPAGKATGKATAANAKDGAIAVDSDKTPVLDATANGVDAALALIVPVASAAPQTPATTPDSDTSAGSSGKTPGSAAIAALTAVIEAKTAKHPDSPALAALTTVLDAKIAKQSGSPAPATPTPGLDAQPADIEGVPADGADPASAPATPKADANRPPQAPVLPDQAAAAADTAFDPPPPPVGTAAAATAPAVANASAKTAEPTDGKDTQGKDKGQAIKAVHVEGARTDATQLASSSKPGVVVPTSANDAGKDASSDQRDHSPALPADGKGATTGAAQGSDFNFATNSAAATNPAALAHAAALVRGSPQTIANLAAQIARKLDGRSTRFDVQLDPAGLGRVDVRVEIDAAGKMTAAMNFDNQQAANELKARAGELQRALEQAGFDMSGGLSFDVASEGGQGRSQGHDADAAPVFRGRAFQAAIDGGSDAPSLIKSSFGRASRSGVDIRI